MSKDELAKLVRRHDPFWPALYTFTRPYGPEWPEVGMFMHIIDQLKNMDATTELKKAQKDLAMRLDADVQNLYDVKTKMYFELSDVELILAEGRLKDKIAKELNVYYYGKT